MRNQKLEDGLRSMRNGDTVLKAAVLTGGTIILTMLVSGADTKKIVTTVFLVVFMFVLFDMELNFAQKLEKDNHPVLRINSEQFKKQPEIELARYIDDTSHYNNLWRIAMAGACAVCLFLMPVIQTTVVPLFPYLFLVIFAVLYHTWNWKLHHSYGFVLKSVTEACRHLGITRNRGTCHTAYTQSKHI